MGDNRIYPRKRTYKFGQFQFKGILKYSIFSLLKTSRAQIDRVLFTDQECRQCRIAVKTKCMRVSWKKTMLVSNKRSFHTRRIFVCFRTSLKYWIEFHLFRCKNSLPPSKAHLDSRRTKKMSFERFSRLHKNKILMSTKNTIESMPCLKVFCG